MKFKLEELEAYLRGEIEELWEEMDGIMDELEEPYIDTGLLPKEFAQSMYEKYTSQYLAEMWQKSKAASQMDVMNTIELFAAAKYKMTAAIELLDQLEKGFIALHSKPVEVKK